MSPRSARGGLQQSGWLPLPSEHGLGRTQTVADAPGNWGDILISTNSEEFVKTLEFLQLSRMGELMPS